MQDCVHPLVNKNGPSFPLIHVLTNPDSPVKSDRVPDYIILDFDDLDSERDSHHPDFVREFG
jgi:hypothetical protein